MHSKKIWQSHGTDNQKTRPRLRALTSIICRGFMANHFIVTIIWPMSLVAHWFGSVQFRIFVVVASTVEKIKADTVFPRIVSAETFLFWKLECGNYSREETNQGRKLLIFRRFWPRKLFKGFCMFPKGSKVWIWIDVTRCTYVTYFSSSFTLSDINFTYYIGT